VKAEALRQWRRQRQRRRLAIAVVLGVLLVGLAIGAVLFWPHSASHTIRIAPHRSPSASTASGANPLNLPSPDLLKPIAPDEAIKENEGRPFSGRPDTAAAPFKLKTDPASADRALDCLSQAVYYEAAGEGEDGERAVAQVVLNRMRHPAYPSTVCGVVYQGSDRMTGCQFTFTCDGSLARMPVGALWKQAQRIAKEALSGKVYAPVGHATHYHADYVLPFWADSLDKSVKIGRHIFYRLKYGLGSPSAFSQRYGGHEPEPPAPSTVQVAMEAVQDADPLLIAPHDDTGLAVENGELLTSAQPKQELVADATQGTLLIDGDAAKPAADATKPKPKDEEGCAASTGGKPLRPMSANDVRANPRGNGC
jgi:spore germination cell wall hydrolase CwlJ-like protein